MNSQVADKDKRITRAKEQRIKRKFQILQVAKKIIGKKGFHSTSVADVIEEAGISRGTFYLYFESREALFNELLDGFILQLKESIQAVELFDQDPVGKIYDNLLRVLNLLKEQEDLTTILLREAVGNVHLDVVHDKVGQLNAFLHRMVRGALVNGAKLGLTRKVNEDLISVAIIGTIKEVVHHYLVDKKGSAPSSEVMAKELLELGIRGLQKS